MKLKLLLDVFVSEQPQVGGRLCQSYGEAYGPQIRRHDSDQFSAMDNSFKNKDRTADQLQKCAKYLRRKMRKKQVWKTVSE